MPTFAFWNINKNVSRTSIADFARERDVDVLVLAEDHTSTASLLRVLNRKADRKFFADAITDSRLTVLTRFRYESKFLVYDDPYTSIRHYDLPLNESILVVATHLPSKLQKKTEDQVLGSGRFAKIIENAESQVGHSRTIVIGDLNMNPFEVGVVGAGGLHAVMDRDIAARETRIVSSTTYPFFYNPMWSVFGNSDGAPPGTYFYDNSGSEVNFYWNVFDQVLLRPSLIDLLKPNSISVVTEIKGKSLLTVDGQPDKTVMSDHLPLLCRLDEKVSVLDDD